MAKIEKNCKSKNIKANNSWFPLTELYDEEVTPKSLSRSPLWFLC